MCLINVLINLCKMDTPQEKTIFPDVLGRPFLTVSNTDPVSINFLCHR